MQTADCKSLDISCNMEVGSLSQSACLTLRGSKTCGGGQQNQFRKASPFVFLFGAAISSKCPTYTHKNCVLFTCRSFSSVNIHSFSLAF